MATFASLHYKDNKSAQNVAGKEKKNTHFCVLIKTCKYGFVCLLELLKHSISGMTRVPLEAHSVLNINILHYMCDLFGCYFENILYFCTCKNT
jgi:hypothetical protein